MTDKNESTTQTIAMAGETELLVPVTPENPWYEFPKCGICGHEMINKSDAAIILCGTVQYGDGAKDDEAVFLKVEKEEQTGTLVHANCLAVILGNLPILPYK